LNDYNAAETYPLLMQLRDTSNESPSSRPTVLAGQPQPGIDLLGHGFSEFSPGPAYHPDALSHHSSEVISHFGDIERGLGSFTRSSVG
jgi:hypothetical protein